MHWNWFSVHLIVVVDPPQYEPSPLLQSWAGAGQVQSALGIVPVHSLVVSLQVVVVAPMHPLLSRAHFASTVELVHTLPADVQ